MVRDRFRVWADYTLLPPPLPSTTTTTLLGHSYICNAILQIHMYNYSRVDENRIGCLVLFVHGISIKPEVSRLLLAKYAI